MIICTFQYRVERSRHFESALVIKNGALFMGDSIQANKKVCFSAKQTFLDSLHSYFSIQAKDFVFFRVCRDFRRRVFLQQVDNGYM